jgi:hypothetical protein
VADRAGTGQAGVFEVIWTWCPAATGGAPLRPWSRVVRMLANEHVAVARLVDDSPFLSVLAARDSAGAAIDPEGARSQLSFDALAPYAGLIVVEGICAAIRGPVHRHLSSEACRTTGARARTGPLNDTMAVVGANLPSVPGTGASRESAANASPVR